MSQKHENPADSQTPKTFEQALAELEKIVSEVEQGQVGLEQTIEKYEQGMKLFQHCRQILEQAEKRIEKITQENAPSGDSSPRE